MTKLSALEKVKLDEAAPEVSAREQVAGARMMFGMTRPM